MFQYKKDTTLEYRKKECENTIKKYPQRIPIICERNPKSRLREVKKIKYLVPIDMPVTQFSFLIRRGINLSAECALYLLADGTYSLAGNKTMREVYEAHKDPQDGLLYIMYSEEERWGY